MTEKKQILIIDDEPTTLRVLEKILSTGGYDVIAAASGVRGVELFKKHFCDLVITDMVMPVKDGLQTIMSLREIAPGLPVIAVSGGGHISKERYLAVAGYLDGVVTIPKPFSAAVILDAVKNLLSSVKE